jgi:hypothetical protein
VINCFQVLSFSFNLRRYTKATTIAVSEAYLREHAALVAEYHNVSHWQRL